MDYSILMTTRYREERLALRSPKAAAQQALEHCSQSILTSGLTFFAATFGVAAISKVELLESICMLISRGALISMAVILLVLPAALMLLDGLICRTTYHWLTAPNAAKGESYEKNAESSAPRWLCGACPDPDGRPLSARFCGDQGPLSKDETVYAVMAADGPVTRPPSASIFTMPTASPGVEDRSTLKNIVNTESFAEYTRNGDTLVWNTDDTDVYYKGRHRPAAPHLRQSDLHAGRQDRPLSELLGQSGHLVLTIDLTNHETGK